MNITTIFNLLFNLVINIILCLLELCFALRLELSPRVADGLARHAGQQSKLGGCHRPGLYNVSTLEKDSEQTDVYFGQRQPTTAQHSHQLGEHVQWQATVTALLHRFRRFFALRAIRHFNTVQQKEWTSFYSFYCIFCYLSYASSG